MEYELNKPKTITKVIKKSSTLFIFIDDDHDPIDDIIRESGE